MADGAKFKLYVEGEKEFKTAINNINSVLKVNRSELSLLAEQYKVTENPMENLKEQQASLSGAMELQAEKSRQIAEQISKTAAVYGEQDARVKNLVISYNESETALAKLQTKYKDTTAAISDAETAMRDMAAAQGDIEADTARFAEVVSEADRQMDEIAQSVENGGRAFGQNKKDIAALNKTYEELGAAIKKQQKNVDGLTEDLKKAEKAYGTGSEKTKDYRKQLDEATESLNDMTAAADENRKKVGELTQDNGGFDGMLGTVEDIAGKLGIDMPKGLSDILGGVSEVTSGLGAWSGAIGAAGAALATVKKMNEDLIETADKYKDLYVEAQQLGVDTTEYQKLQYAMQMTGVESSELEGLFNALNGKIKEVDKVIGDYAGNMDALQNATDEERKAVADAMEEWNQFGVSLYDQNGDLRDTIDIFYDVIDAFDDYSNKTERITKLQELFGESASKLNPAIDAGATNIRKFADEAEAAGVVMDELAVSRMYALSTAAEVQSKKMDVLKDKWTLFTHDLFDFANWGSGNLSQSASSFFKQYFQGKLFGYATGTQFAPGGWSVVGEKGPEIVRLPRGSEVYPNGVTPRIESGGNVSNYYNVEIRAADVREFNDIVRLAQAQRQAVRSGYVRG